MTTYYLREVRTTKPAGVPWWGEIFPDQAKAHLASMKALNLIVAFKEIAEDENNKKYQMYFDSVESYDTFRSIIFNGSMEYIYLHVRHEYNVENLITETILYSDTIEVDPATL